MLFVFGASFAEDPDLWVSYFKIQLLQTLATGHILTTPERSSFRLVEKVSFREPK